MIQDDVQTFEIPEIKNDIINNLNNLINQFENYIKQF